MARCHQLRLKHDEDVEQIDEREMPHVHRLVLELERRVRALESGKVAER